MSDDAPYQEGQDDGQQQDGGYLGGSSRSLGASSSILPAPETTRPPHQLSARSLISASSIRSLTSVGTADVETEEETRRIAEELQEEEMLRLAMEQSLNDNGLNNFFRSGAYSPMRKSNRSLTSVRSAPGVERTLDAFPPNLTQSFRVPPSRRRRGPSNLQPDYDDDMFDLSPRDEDDAAEAAAEASATVTPGAVAVATPPPAKSSEVRAAIESFVERGIELPLERSSDSRGESAQPERRREQLRRPPSSEPSKQTTERSASLRERPHPSSSTSREISDGGSMRERRNRESVDISSSELTRESSDGVRERRLKKEVEKKASIMDLPREISQPVRHDMTDSSVRTTRSRGKGIDGGSSVRTTERRSRGLATDGGGSSVRTTERRSRGMATDGASSVRTTERRSRDTTTDGDSSFRTTERRSKERTVDGVSSVRTTERRPREQAGDGASSVRTTERRSRGRTGDAVSAALPIELSQPLRHPSTEPERESDARPVRRQRDDCRRKDDRWRSADTRRHREPATIEVAPLKSNVSPSRAEASSRQEVSSSAWKSVDTSGVESAATIEWPALGQEDPTEAATSSSYDLSGAEEHLTPEELKQIELALKESSPVYHETKVQETKVPFDDYDEPDRKLPAKVAQDFMTDDEEEDEEQLMPCTMVPMAAAAAAPNNVISEADSVVIMQAIREADRERELRKAEEEKKSLEAIALLMQQEQPNAGQFASGFDGGNVRLMSRAEYDAQQISAQFRTVTVQSQHDEDDDDDYVEEGYRMNSSAPQRWARRDQHSVVGPNREVRTKHDAVLNGKSNAHRLGLEENSASVGNKAYNSFKQSMKSTKKGVATAGSGRAGSDATGTRTGGLDENVRSIITRAINNGIIEKCNGVVNEGKEAVIFHANEGMESDGFDVAIKVFKRIQEFRNRGEYVEGDPWYTKSSFSNANSREQLELWAEKEFRNLMRAHNADVPVPAPLLIKENVVFMRFLGKDWPSPQLKEVELSRGSKRWDALYGQVVDAVKRLYQTARLVHGDLSEYNILVVPARYIQKSVDYVGKTSEDEVKIVLIDLAQAVDTRHPSAKELLSRDIYTILNFFSKQGVEIPSHESVFAYVQTSS